MRNDDAQLCLINSCAVPTIEKFEHHAHTEFSILQPGFTRVPVIFSR